MFTVDLAVLLQAIPLSLHQVRPEQTDDVEEGEPWTGTRNSLLPPQLIVLIVTAADNFRQKMLEHEDFGESDLHDKRCYGDHQGSNSNGQSGQLHDCRRVAADDVGCCLLVSSQCASLSGEGAARVAPSNVALPLIPSVACLLIRPQIPCTSQPSTEYIFKAANSASHGLSLFLTRPLLSILQPCFTCFAY